MLRFRSGDLQAFEDLLDRWEGPAKRYAQRVLGDFQIAEDVAQEAFLRLYRSADSYRPTGRFSSYFYTILGNLCRDRIRRRRRRPEETATRSLDEGTREPPDPGVSLPGPEDALLAAEERALVGQAVRDLPSHLMQAVALREFEGLKYREIADTLGCDVNQVKVLIHRGRKALAQRLRRLLRR